MTDSSDELIAERYRLAGVIRRWVRHETSLRELSSLMGSEAATIIEHAEAIAQAVVVGGNQPPSDPAEASSSEAAVSVDANEEWTAEELAALLVVPRLRQEQEETNDQGFHSGHNEPEVTQRASLTAGNRG